MTNLTPVEIPTEDVNVPNEGEFIVAETPGIGNGPVRPGFQKLFNKIHSIFRGRAGLRAISVNPATAGQLVNPADGTIDASGVILSLTAMVAPLGQFVTALADTFRSSNVAGRLEMVSVRLLWTLVTTGADGANPPRTTALLNDLRALTICKGWCRITTNGIGGFVVPDGANVALVTMGGVGTYTMRIDWAQPLADANYCVMVSASRPGDVAGAKAKRVAAIVYATTHCEVECETDPRGSVLEINAVAFGRQTS